MTHTLYCVLHKSWVPCVSRTTATLLHPIRQGLESHCVAITTIPFSFQHPSALISVSPAGCIDEGCGSMSGILRKSSETNWNGSSSRSGMVIRSACSFSI